MARKSEQPASRAKAPKSAKNANEGLLLNVIDDIGRKVACAQLDPQKLPKIANEMSFRPCVAVAKALHVVSIK